MVTSLVLVELVVTGFLCFVLSFAIVAVLIQAFTKKAKKRGNREKESLLNTTRSSKRFQKKIKIQKSSMIPAKHLRSLSVEFTESPLKHLYKYPRQHYRRKSSPNLICIPRNKTKDALINIYPKCEKLFSLHQIQPTTTTTPSSMESGKNNRCVGLTTGNGKYITPVTMTIKARHLFLPEGKEYVTEYYTSPTTKAVMGLDKLNEDYEQKLYFTKEK